MKVYAAAILLLPLVVAPSYATDSAHIQPKDIIGKWQKGLTEKARKIPIDTAFKIGVTATVMQLNADGTLIVETPCQHTEFNKKFGGPFVMKGTWSLSNESVLTTTVFVKFRDDPKGQTYTETGAVSVAGDDMTLLTPSGKIIPFGRFYAETRQECKDI